MVVVEKDSKCWFLYDNKPMEGILLEEQENCFKVQAEKGLFYTRKVFENIVQAEAYIEKFMPNPNLRELSLNRIIEGRMDIVDILISLLTNLDEERIVRLRRCIVEIQKRGYANFDNIRLMSNCGIPIYKQYIEDKKIKEHITESFTMDFELCKKYITEFVIGLSVDVIKRIDFDYGYTRSEVVKL